MDEASTERRKAHHHGDLREALIRAAIGHVRQEGAASFSLRHASAGAGVTPGAAYRHFNSRADVLDAVVVEGFARLAQSMADCAKGLEGSDRLRAVGRAYVDFAKKEPHLFALMFGPEGAEGRTKALRADFGVPNPSDQLRLALQSAGVDSDSANDRAWGLAHGLAGLAAAGARVDANAAIADFVQGLMAKTTDVPRGL